MLRDEMRRRDGSTPSGRTQSTSYRQKQLKEKINSAKSKLRQARARIEDAIALVEAGATLEIP